MSNQRNNENTKDSSSGKSNARFEEELPDVEEVTRIANAGVQSYFDNADRRRAAAQVTTAVAEGGRGTARKKTKIVASEVVELQQQQQQSSANTPAVPKVETFMVDDDDDGMDDDDEWEVAVDAEDFNVDGAAPVDILLKKEQKIEIKTQKLEPKMEPQSQQQQQRVLGSSASLAIAVGQDDGQDLGVSASIQKASAAESRQRLVRASCSLFLFHVARGHWIRRVACSGRVAVALRQRLAFTQPFQDAAALLSQQQQTTTNLANLSRNLGALRSSWLLMENPLAPPAAAPAAANKKSGTKKQPQQQPPAAQQQPQQIFPIARVVEIIGNAMKTAWQISLPDLPQRHGDPAAAVMDDGTAKGADKSAEAAKKVFCDMGQINQCPPPQFLKPFLPEWARNIYNNSSRKKKTSSSASSSSLRLEPVQHSLWWNILFAAMCNSVASRDGGSLIDVRICIAFDLDAAKEMERELKEKEKEERVKKYTAGGKAATVTSAAVKKEKGEPNTAFDDDDDDDDDDDPFAAAANKNKRKQMKAEQQQQQQQQEIVVVDNDDDDDAAGSGAGGRTKKRNAAAAAPSPPPSQDIWCEIWHPDRECYVPVQTISRAEQQALGIGGTRWNAPYVLAFGSHGSVTDVSVRYATSWAKIFPTRLDHLLRTHHNGELDANKELKERYAFALSPASPDFSAFSPAAVVRTVAGCTKTLAPLVRNCEYLLPQTVCWTDRILARHNANLMPTQMRSAQLKSKLETVTRFVDRMKQRNVGDAAAAADDDNAVSHKKPKASKLYRRWKKQQESRAAAGVGGVKMEQQQQQTRNLNDDDDDPFAVAAAAAAAAAAATNSSSFSSSRPSPSSWDSTHRLIFRLTRDRLQLHLVKYADPVPSTLAAIKQHPLYICDQHISRHETIHPRDASTTVGLFRGAPVYRRAALRPLRGIEGWLRLKRMVVAGQEPAKVCPPPASRPLGRPSRLFGMWQTVPYQPLPPIVGPKKRPQQQLPLVNDDDDEDALLGIGKSKNKKQKKKGSSNSNKNKKKKRTKNKNKKRRALDDDDDDDDDDDNSSSDSSSSSSSSSDDSDGDDVIFDAARRHKNKHKNKRQKQKQQLQDEEEEDSSHIKIPTINDHLDWYVFLRGYALPAGLAHFTEEGARSVVRKMNIDFCSAVVGFERAGAAGEMEGAVVAPRAIPIPGTGQVVRVKSTRQAATPAEAAHQQMVVGSGGGGGAAPAAAFHQHHQAANNNSHPQRKPWRAVFNGIVVKSQDEPKLKRAMIEFREVRERKERERRRARALMWWNILITRRLALNRLQQQVRQ